MSLDKEFTASWPKMSWASWKELGDDQRTELWRRCPGLCPEPPPLPGIELIELEPLITEPHEPKTPVTLYLTLR